ncbi:hypothetical protein BV25DRAFT_1919997 [Artomyces pyxidatus]|uniref:Uncharacterized protein n=1 Tax=Artomyces pyxidatus TaxID=48021 RepID=A0ACB8SN87_9AGAM|nr:hypothetical protein BV25DRAFT_1919997 [Artomyces pyxidatus]
MTPTTTPETHTPPDPLIARLSWYEGYPADPAWYAPGPGDDTALLHPAHFSALLSATGTAFRVRRAHNGNKADHSAYVLTYDAQRRHDDARTHGIWRACRDTMGLAPDAVPQAWYVPPARGAATAWGARRRLSDEERRRVRRFLRTPEAGEYLFGHPLGGRPSQAVL